MKAMSRGGVESPPAALTEASSPGMTTSFSLPAAGFNAAERRERRHKHA